MSSTWQSIAAKKGAERDAAIPPEWKLKSLPLLSQLDVRSIPSTCGILTPAEVAITSNHDATSLLAALHARSVTSLAVATAFCKRAAVAQQLTNCLTEIFFDQALARAKELDAYIERTGHPIGPLHGLPISLKDTFDIEGLDSSIGIAALANKPAKKNGALVEILLKAGAVIYVKTNIPQTLMSLDSINNVFGRTMNPANRLLTAGGSSGGEGALIALRGSILGVGTDVGGSIRIPAMCNGLYGFKPSTGRLPYRGQISAMRSGSGGLGLKASAGPLATSLRDIQLLMEVVSNAKAWESEADVVPGFWESQGQTGGEWEKPVFGVIRTDNVVTPLPPVANILDETVQALKSAGLEVIEVDSAAFSRCQGLTNKFFSAGGDTEMLDLLEETGEPVIPWLEGKMQRREGKGLRFLEERHVDRAEVIKEMLQIFRTPDGRRIDAVILPVAPHPVPEIDRWNAVGYTSSFVLLDWPAGTVPIRKVTERDLEGELEGKPLGSWDKKGRELWDRKTVDRKVYLDSMLSVQMVAPRLQERRLWQAMDIVDRVVKEKISVPAADKAKL